MTIYDPDPEARAKAIHAELALAADVLRQNGAKVEIHGHSGGRIHTLAMTITMRCPASVAEETARKLEGIAKRTSGMAYSSLNSPVPAGLPDGEYGFGLLYSVAKPSSRKLRRAA